MSRRHPIATALRITMSKIGMCRAISIARLAAIFAWTKAPFTAVNI